MSMIPETCYTQNGEITIAYQTLGSGPVDLVLVPGFVSHLELNWEEPSYARYLQRLASFSRLILFDKRGVGLSDRVGDLPTLEQRMDDVRAVMDRVGSQRAAILGVSEGGPMCALFAATYPERTTALIMYGAFARSAWAPDYPWGPTWKEFDEKSEQYRREWGGPVGLESLAPSMINDERFRQWWAKYFRQGSSPGALNALRRMNMEIDARSALQAIHVPTLILHRTGDRAISIEEGRYLAERIPGAQLVELEGVDHVPWVGNWETIADEIQTFVTGERPAIETDRVLATVLFTDMVNSTQRLAELGDRRWRDLLETHHSATQNEVTRFRGRLVENTGDGYLATFDGPARAIQCALAIDESLRKIGVQIRAGLHTGEVELMGARVGGIAVHLAARVMAKAGADEVWVSRTVKDLVVGSGLEFRERGVFELKGIPGEWSLFQVDQAA